MARPTNEVKKHYVGIRLTDSEYESLGENKSEAIRGLINKGFVKQNEDSFVLQNSFVKQYDLNKLIDSLEWCVGMGILEIVDNEICVTTGFDEPKQNDYLEEELKNLSNACDEKGISVKDALRKTAQSIWSIRQ